jgi:hypothetical protein
MPWFPDFANAAELARQQTRVAGHSDPVQQYFAALNSGNVHPLETSWPGEVVVYDPRAGEVRGHKELRKFIHRNQSWLAQRNARTEVIASTRVGRRAVVEILAHLSDGGRELSWPVAVVAESATDRSIVFRTYCSQWPVDGRRHIRPPILAPIAARPPDVVGRFQQACEAGNTAAVVGMFAPDGYYREALGTANLHRGTAELRAYFDAAFEAGGVLQECCELTDDGTRCAVEYNCLRWGSQELVPQAGLGVYERNADGFLAAARIYDDIDAPSAPL